MLERVRDTYYRIKDASLIILYGFFIGLCLSYIAFAYIHFSISFKLTTVGIFLFIFIINLIRLKVYSDSLLWAGFVLSTFLIHFAMIGFFGTIWLFISENFYTGFYETFALIVLFPLITLGTTFIFLLRLVWHKNTVSKNLEQNIKAIKFLLGFRKY